MIEKSYNKTVIDFNFGRHKDLSNLKSDIRFFGLINPYVYLIEVNNCIILHGRIFVMTPKNTMKIRKQHCKMKR